MTFNPSQKLSDYFLVNHCVTPHRLEYMEKSERYIERKHKIQALATIKFNPQSHLKEQQG